LDLDGRRRGERRFYKEEERFGWEGCWETEGEVENEGCELEEKMERELHSGVFWWDEL
jgi:hypothetical protein